jgi:APA family basic amino acid/polyamine antiporter
MQTTDQKTKLGLITLVCLIIGNMIGAGLYVSSFYSLSSLGDARLVLLVWVIGGVHALCGAVAYGAVAKRLPVSGGEYAFLSRCVHPGLGFVAGWISIVAGFTAPIAVTSLLLSQYILDMTPLANPSSEWIKKAIATIAILVAAGMYSVHLRLGTGFNNLIVAFKLGCFVLFLAFGIPFILSTPSDGMYVRDAGAMGPRPLFESLGDLGTWSAMFIQLFYVSLAYTGFNASIYLAGDLSDDRASASKLVARSMWVSCAAVMVIYIMLNAVFLYGLDGKSIVAAGEGFVPVVASHVGGEWLGWVMRIAIILSATTSVFAMMATGPMVYIQMARDNLLPGIVLGPSQNTRRAVLIQAILCCVVVWVSTIEGLISYLGLTLTACGAMAVSSVWFAKSRLEQASPILLHEHAATAIYVVGAIGLLLVASQSDKQAIRLYLCLGTFALGAIFYAIGRSGGEIATDASSHT